jgi:hypothetical protein
LSRKLAPVIFLSLTLLTMFSLVSIRLTVAQNNASQQVFLSISQLNFVGQQGVTLNRTLIAVGITNQSVSVALVATDIYDNAAGNTILASSVKINPASFSLSQANEQAINISVDTSGVPIGTYQGAIVLTSTNATTTSTTNIPLTVYIEPLTSVLNQQGVYLPISQLNFVGQQGLTNLNRTLVVVGLTNQTINVKLVPTELYDNTTGKIIPASSLVISPSSFTLSQSNETINISIRTSGVTADTWFQAATYQGAIILTSTNATTTMTSSIPITVKMEPYLFLSYWLIFFIAMIISILISFLLAEIDPVAFPHTKFLVVCFGLLAIALYFLSIITTSLTDPGNIIATVLIAPFGAYLIGYVKDLRTDQSSLENAARQSRNKNIGTDIDTLVNLIGELSTHYVSFTSGYYEDGLISDTVWKKERKEGTSSDFPLVRIEQHYSFVAKYNQYYSYALKPKAEKQNEKQAENKNVQQYESRENTLGVFEIFRKQYAQLQTLLFVNLQYDLGRLTDISLSPLRMDYPRITRALLYVLVDSEALKAPPLANETLILENLTFAMQQYDWNSAKANLISEQNSDALKVLDELYKKDPKNREVKAALDNANQNSDALKVLKELANKNLKAFIALSNMMAQEVAQEKDQALDDIDKLSKENLDDIDKLSKENPAVSEAATTAATTLLSRQNWEAQTALSYLRKEKYKKEIEKSGVSPGRLKGISKEIYKGKNTQKFLAFMEVQFTEKHRELTEISERLPTLHPSQPQDKPEQKKEEPQIKGTFAVGIAGNEEGKSS